MFIFVVIVFSIIAGLGLLSPGLPPTHDGEYHIIRFYEFNRVLMDGNLYPRWAPDLNFGFGVPLFNYVYPLPNFLASFIHLFNFSFIDAFKLNMFIATIVGGIFFYLWSRKFWGNLGGVVSSIFYTFSPYHFVDIYIRGSVGEVWALALFPAFLWSITIMLREERKNYIIYSGIFLALIIFAHNILALMFFVFSFIYCLFIIFHLKKIKFSMLKTLSVILIGLGLSSIFWLPALLEKQYVTGLQLYNIKDNFADLYQLIFPSWGSGFSNGDLQNQMSLQVGVGNLLVVTVSIFLIPFFVKIKKTLLGVQLFFVVSFFFIFFLMTKESLFIWNSIPLMNYFQFPWRFLSIEILISSFIAGGLLSLFKSNFIKFSVASFMIVVIVLLGIGYAKPAYYHNRSDNYYILRSNFIDGTNSPGDYFNTVWAENAKKREKEKIKVLGGNAEFKLTYSGSTYYNYKITAKEDSKFVANITYFPGWEVFLDKKGIEKELNKNGLISFEMPKGEHLIEVKLGETRIQKIGKLSFLITLFFIVFALLRSKYCAKINK
ncbi:hypothetical protein C4559_03390 [Candidatus Microgenomates bacterium]|nr:MAG: hypothetical protein C4559_03390 [Candidatus Microgenomates bacterium]